MNKVCVAHLLQPDQNTLKKVAFIPKQGLFVGAPHKWRKDRKKREDLNFKLKKKKRKTSNKTEDSGCEAKMLSH